MTQFENRKVAIFGPEMLEIQISTFHKNYPKNGDIKNLDKNKAHLYVNLVFENVDIFDL